MTFSIVARSADGSAWGVAVASKFLAAGALVPAAAAGAGALASQSYVNLAYRDSGLALLREGLSAQETLTRLTGEDEAREQRQLGLVDAGGRAATFTGSQCQPWAGGRVGDGYAVQGNVLVGPEVLDAMAGAWQQSGPELALPRRLLAALAAGDAAGGDRRGRQSAALLVVSPGAGYAGGSDVAADLRVDDAPDPVPELERLLGLHELFFGASDPAGLLPLAAEVLAETYGLLVQVGYPPAAPELPAVQAALWEWAGWENLELRIQPEPLLDPVVLEILRMRAAEHEPGPTKSVRATGAV